MLGLQRSRAKLALRHHAVANNTFSNLVKAAADALTLQSRILCCSCFKPRWLLNPSLQFLNFPHGVFRQGNVFAAQVAPLPRDLALITTPVFDWSPRMLLHPGSNISIAACRAKLQPFVLNPLCFDPHRILFNSPLGFLHFGSHVRKQAISLAAEVTPLPRHRALVTLTVLPRASLMLL